MSPITSGAVVNESLETNIEGVFACGNVLHVHDLVDFVAEEAAMAGKSAADYVQGKINRDTKTPDVKIVATAGVRYSVPRVVNVDRMDGDSIVKFRVRDVYNNHYVSVHLNDERILHRKKQVMAPGEMENVVLKKDQLAAFDGLNTITVKLEEA